MTLRKRTLEKQVQSSNLSPKSLDVLKMKVQHQLAKKQLIVPQSTSWDELKRANIWLGFLEEEVKTIFNVRSIPHLDAYAQKLVDQHKK